MKSYDFAGWATRNNLRCSDGRTIMKDAFKDDDGRIVPLVWNHQHDSVENVLGHALLKNEEDGVRAYCTFNDTEAGNTARHVVEHGDVVSLSIYANQLREQAGHVIHGAIRELSLVLAGANPGAYIDSLVLTHGEDSEGEAIIYTGEDIVLEHSEIEQQKDDHNEEESMYDEDEYLEHADDGDDGETVGDIIESMNEKQRNVLNALVGQALSENPDEEYDDDDEEESEMKHNIFESDAYEQDNVLSHSDMQQIFRDAKRVGSLREAVENYLEDGQVLAHSIDTTGMTVATGTQTYGLNDVDMLFPEYKSLNTPPEFIQRNMDWVQKVMGSVHHTPFTRIKSMYANITEDEARARGYIKGNQKKNEVFTTLKRTTDPQTIYKKQKLDRDDIIDITDFDVVAWIKQEMRMMLNEEIARAILIGDGRQTDSDDHISHDHIRPIVTDVPLFNITYTVDNFSAKTFIDECVRARKKYKGSGNPTLFTTEDLLTEMLLIEDGIGHKLYKSEAELATALRVSSIVTVEPMEGYKIGTGNNAKDLLGVIVNLTDYNVGTDKGGEINMFDDFDIDFNQYAYLMETRMSGALVKPFSAITLLKGTVGYNKATTKIDADTTDVTP